MSEKKIIAGGTVVDGTGRGAFRGDVIVEGGFIYQPDRYSTPECPAIKTKWR